MFTERLYSVQNLLDETQIKLSQLLENFSPSPTTNGDEAMNSKINTIFLLFFQFSFANHTKLTFFIYLFSGVRLFWCSSPRHLHWTVQKGNPHEEFYMRNFRRLSKNSCAGGDFYVLKTKLMKIGFVFIRIFIERWEWLR